MTNFVFIIEIIGTIAFAISGAIVAIKKNMDIFGVLVLGVTTAVGGGMIRDILLGVLPPTMFRNSIYVIVAVITTLLVFLVMFFLQGKINCYSKRVDRFINVFDSVGLGVFVVAGVNTAGNNGFGELAFLSIFVGVVTGIGGGILRDILAGRIGASVYYYTCDWIGTNAAMIVGLLLTITLRMLATYLEWSLPKIDDKV